MGDLRKMICKVCGINILYSPVYYWYKFILSVWGTVGSFLVWGHIKKQCDDPGMLASVWDFALIALWAFAGLIHAAIIVGRLLKKSPPSDKLYDGPLVGKVVHPMNLCYGLVFVLSVIGIVFIHTKHSSTACTDDWGAVLTHTYIMAFISISMLKKVGRGQSDDEGDAKEAEDV